MKFFPDQDIPESQKDQRWCNQVMDYCIYNFDSYRARRVRRMNELFLSYNGEHHPDHLKFLTNTYGKVNRGRFMPMRIARPKISLITGEFLVRPVNSTVSTINPEAKSRRLDQFHVQMGLMTAGKEVQTIRDQAGIDLFNGMEIPNKDTFDPTEGMNTKEKNEHLMQIIINDSFKRQDLKSKLSNNFEHLTITSECYGKVEINSMNNQVGYRPIDPRNKLTEESEYDPFGTKSPYKGERRLMFVHEIIAEFPELTADERKSLRNLQAHYYSTTTQMGRNYYQLVSQQLLVEVFTVEWKSVRPYYFITIPDKNPDNPPIKKMIMPEDWEDEKKNKEYMRNISKNGGSWERKYYIDIWETTRIGHAINIRSRRKPYQLRSLNNPTEVSYSYTDLYFNTIDGTRISLWELTENLNFMYDVVCYQINRELAKNKGKVVVFDKAFLDKDMTLTDVMYGIANDGLMVINSAQDGNKIGREVQVQGQLREVDLGISQSVQVLIPLKQEIKATIDTITGINNDREGMTMASSTATNAQQNITASRTMTESLFYFMNRYVENVLTKIIETTKIVWGTMDPSVGEMVVGDAAIGFFKVTRDILSEDFAAFVSDGGKEMKMRELINRLAETSLNTKELRLHDVLDVELAETMVSAKNILKRAWKEVQDIAAQNAQAQQQAEAQAQQQAQQDAIANREDEQQHEADMIILKAKMQRDFETQKASNTFVNNQANQDDKQATQLADRSMGFSSKPLK